MSEIKQITALMLLTLAIAGLGLALIKYFPFFTEGDAGNSRI
jgi:hypothetical protein